MANKVDTLTTLKEKLKKNIEDTERKLAESRRKLRTLDIEIRNAKGEEFTSALIKLNLTDKEWRAVRRLTSDPAELKRILLGRNDVVNITKGEQNEK